MSPTSECLFILVDDDEVNNSISRLTIANTIPHAEIKTFSEAKSVLRFLENDFDSTSSKSVILLLNLNMPFFSGWDFLQQFADLDDEIQRRVEIYILSSSINPADRKRSEGISSVKGFLHKPLSPEMILKM